jgi:hypothetical protein
MPKQMASPTTRFSTEGLCRYPETGVPLTTVRRRYTRAATSSHVVNSTLLHHVDGSGVATWLGRTIYSKMPTVGLDPHGKVSDPCTCRSDLRARSRTPAGATRTPEIGPRPLCVGSGLPTAESRDSGTENTQTLLRQGSGADMCPGPA